jgi:ferritin heavy chain
LQSLLELHKIADDSKDPQLMDFIESEYLKEQVEAISDFGHLITRMKRAGEGLGIHLIDKELKE